MRFLLLLLNTLLLVSCARNFSEDFKKISVGMTYEEVEKGLGKPQQIKRGLNKLHITKETNKAAASLKALFARDDIEQMSKSEKSDFLVKFIIVYPDTLSIEIEEAGNQIYVRWEYDLAPTLTDTTIVADIPAIVCDTSYIRGLRYFFEKRLHGKISMRKREITKENYERNLAAIETNKLLMDFMEEQGLEFRYWSEMSEKAQFMKFNNYRIKERAKVYTVAWKQFILFDASSGRVTSTDYQPTACTLME